MKQFHLNGVHSCISFDFSFSDFLLFFPAVIIHYFAFVYKPVWTSRLYGLHSISQQLRSFLSKIEQTTLTKNSLA